MADRKRYVYSCGEHEVSSPKKLQACPGFILGAPCTSKLKQTAGPRK